ncbi:MAG: hypothetical protein M3Q07_16750 [Pseudobdellovibrionaceae bacterium]|nr:hypothetical protein [Pseudobdellovibrionaceae bacterium]
MSTGKSLAIALVAFLTTAKSLFAAYVEPVHPIVSDGGRIAGFTTEDPNLVYMVPQSWEIYRGNVYQNATGFAMVLAPTYDQETLAKYKLAHPGQALIPMPHKLNEARLFLGELLDDAALLGKIKYEVSPDNLSNQSDIVYFNLEVTADTQDFFKTILTSNTGITGYVELSYPFQSHQVESQIPLQAQTRTVARNLPPNYPLLWLERLSLENCLALDEFLNVQVSLGFQKVHLRSINSSACWMADNVQLAKVSENIYAMWAKQLGVADLRVVTDLLVEELGLKFAGDALFEADVQLDLESITVTMPKFKLISFDPRGQTISPIYKNVIMNQINKNSAQIRDSLAKALTDELRVRIINGNIFI